MLRDNYPLSSPSIAYLISLQLYAEACTKGLLKKVTFEQYSELGYEKVDTGQKARYIPENIVVIEASLFQRPLSARAMKLLMRIPGELHINNALWYYDHLSNHRNDLKAISELRKCGILLKTEDARIHFVNPNYVRKGSKPAVLALTTKELENVSRVSKANIRPLGTKRIEMDIYQLSKKLATISPSPTPLSSPSADDGSSA
jgi:hypothetical protein